MSQPELEALFRPFGQIITSRILADNVTGTFFPPLTFIKITLIYQSSLSIMTVTIMGRDCNLTAKKNNNTT